MFRVFLGLVIILGVLLILLHNTETVTVDLVVRQYENVHLAVVIVVTLAVGILIGFVIALSSLFASKTEARAFRAENKRLTDELNSLRNIAIDEGIYETGNGEE
ncbi:MAG: LapA family protein [Fidelibacterota bacterium]